MMRVMILSGFEFAAVSLIAFSVWAFGGQWFRFPGGELTMYAVIAVVFLGLSGLLMHRHLRGERRLSRFYGAFLPAFFAYAVLWCVAWFVVKGRPGEWIGSLAGSVAFAAVVHWRMKSARMFWISALVLCFTHSLGYFIGGEMMYGTLREGLAGVSKQTVAHIAKLYWGLFYGLGFGIGIGATFHYAQVDGRSDHDA